MIEQLKLAILSILAFLVIYELLSPLIYAVVIFYLLLPLFILVNKGVRYRSLSAVVMSVITILFIVYPSFILVKWLITNSSDITTFSLELLGSISSQLEALDISLDPIITNISGGITSIFSAIVSSIPKLIIQIFVFLAVEFYLFKDYQAINEYVTSLVAKDERIASIFNCGKTVFKTTVYGYIAAGIVVGLISFPIFWALGYSYALFLALIVGVAALIPFLGHWLVYIPLTIYSLYTGRYIIAGITLVFAIVLDLLTLYLSSKIVGGRLKIHPGIMLLGFIGGSLLLGFKGLILGPLIVGTLKLYLDSCKR